MVLQYHFPVFLNNQVARKYNKVMFFVCFIRHHSLKTYRSRLRFLNFCTRWSREISFTLRPLYLRENITRHKTHRWFCGPRTRNRSCRQKTNLLATPERASTFRPCSVLPNHSTDSLAHCYTVYCSAHLSTLFSGMSKRTSSSLRI